MDDVTFSHNGAPSAPMDQNQRWCYDSSSSLGGDIGIEDASFRTLISSWQDFNRQRASRGLSAIADPLVIMAAVHPRSVCPLLAWIGPIFLPKTPYNLTREMKGSPPSCHDQRQSWTSLCRVSSASMSSSSTSPPTLSCFPTTQQAWQ